MAPRDPTEDTEPSFLEEVWDPVRKALIEGSKSEEEAVGVLRQSWKAQHDKDLKRWNKHLRQLQQNPGPGDDTGDDAANPPGAEG
jgi:hypothetical protein